jgi:hypothetical protein
MFFKFIENLFTAQFPPALRDGVLPILDIGKWDRLLFLAVMGNCHFTQSIYADAAERFRSVLSKQERTTVHKLRARRNDLHTVRASLNDRQPMWREFPPQDTSTHIAAPPSVRNLRRPYEAYGEVRRTRD